MPSRCKLVFQRLELLSFVVALLARLEAVIESTQAVLLVSRLSFLSTIPLYKALLLAPAASQPISKPQGAVDSHILYSKGHKWL